MLKKIPLCHGLEKGVHVAIRASEKPVLKSSVNRGILLHIKMLGACLLRVVNGDFSVKNVIQPILAKNQGRPNVITRQK